jgi:hypothetical protein
MFGKKVDPPSPNSYLSKEKGLQRAVSRGYSILAFCMKRSKNTKHKLIKIFSASGEMRLLVFWAYHFKLQLTLICYS